MANCTKCNEPWKSDSHVCNAERVARLEAENARFEKECDYFADGSSYWQRKYEEALERGINLPPRVERAEAERDEFQKLLGRATSERDALREVVDAARPWFAEHRYCDDPSYGCPKNTNHGGYYSGSETDYCNCGKDAFDAALEKQEKAS